MRFLLLHISRVFLSRAEYTLPFMPRHTIISSPARISDYLPAFRRLRRRCTCHSRDIASLSSDTHAIRHRDVSAAAASYAERFDAATLPSSIKTFEILNEEPSDATMAITAESTRHADSSFSFRHATWRRRSSLPPPELTPRD